MLYSLPNGKVIYITLEQYIALTDEDIEYLVSIDFGEIPTSPWIGSCISNNSREIIDDTIDFLEEDNPTLNISSDNLDDERFIPPEDFNIIE